MARRPRVRIGDVFTVPLDDAGETVGYGQIITKTVMSDLTIACFAVSSSSAELVAPAEVVSHDIVLMGFTMDALIYHGVWKVIGNEPSVLDRVTMPLFKVLSGGRWEVVTVDDQLVDTFDSPPEQFDNPWAQSPMVIQKALQSTFGFRAWEPYFDKLRPGYSAARSRLPT
jgi:hypothetical protein